jgi:hypothetical protein
MKKKSAEQTVAQIRKAQKEMEKIDDPIIQESPSILKQHISNIIMDEMDLEEVDQDIIGSTA